MRAAAQLSLAGGTGTEDISVPVAADGPGPGHTAQDTDITAPAPPVTIPAGGATATFEVATLAGGDHDAGEAVAIAIGDPSGSAPNRDAARGVSVFVRVTIIGPNTGAEFAGTAIEVTLEENAV